MIPLVAALLCTAQLLSEVAVDVRQVGLVNQFTQSGTRTVGSTAFGVATNLELGDWHLDVAGAMLSRPAIGHEISGVIGHRNRILWIPVGFQIEYQERKFENCSFSYSDACVSTNRRTQFVLAGFDTRIPFVKSIALRARVSAGFYVDKQWSIVSTSKVMERERLSMDRLPLMSVQLFIRPITVGTRTRINGSMRYAHLFGNRSPWVPGDELSCIVSVDTRAMNIGKHQLLVGGVLHIRPSRVPLTTDTEFSLRVTLMFK